MERIRTKLIAVALPLLATGYAFAADSDSFSGHEVSGEGAWCWFADPRAIHYENADKSINASWLAYIDVHGNVKASQYDFNTGARNEVLVRSYFQPDDHNNPTILVLPDERVLIIYSRHTDEPAFYYRVSSRPGDITSLGEEKKIVTKNNTTYPSPFILSDDPTHFYLCWRGIGWHPTIARLTLPDSNDDVTVDWGPFQIVQSTGARPYAKYCSNGKDRIYLTYTTGHPDNEMPNWLYCNYIDINVSGEGASLTINPQLKDIKGNTLSTISNGKFNVSKSDDYKAKYPLTIVDATADIRDWVWQIILDKDGKPVIPMTKINGGKDAHEYHLAKWNGESWSTTKLSDAGHWFHASSNTEKCYSGGEAIDPENPNTLYLSIPTKGTYGDVFEIWKYTVDANGNVTDKEQITRNSTKNNVRPYVLNGHGDSPLTLAWMNGDYYYWMVNKNYPAGYPTGIRCDYDYTPTANAAEPKATVHPGNVTSNDITSLGSYDKEFSVFFNLSISPDNYKGTILSSPALNYKLSDDGKTIVLTINGVEYKSQNSLLNSDNWASNSGGTNGDYWPTKLGRWNLAMTYDGAYLTTYRNGVIDQKINVAILNAGEITVGGFDGSIGKVSGYDSALSQDAIKEIIASSALDDIIIPETATTDLVLPSQAGNNTLTWKSDNTDLIANDGTFRAPETETVVKLTVSSGNLTREFSVKALPRDIKLNTLARYEFEAADVTGKSVADKSGNGRDLTLAGNAKANGTLDLTANESGSFASNGYAVLPSGLLDGLRSYTVMFTATPSSVSGHPRFYDLGLNSGNSLFFRTEALSAGIKYQGGTTTMVNSSTQLTSGNTYELAVTFDARTKTTKIYVNGKETVSGTANVNEPYMLAQAGNCTRNYIGRTQWWDSSVAKDNQDYIGTIDNLFIFNTALSPEEMAEVKTTVGVEKIPAATEKVSGDIYDLSGRKVKDSQDGLKGIFIVGGAKVAK